MAASSFDRRGLGREDPKASYNVPPHVIRVQLLRACILTYMRKHGNIATAMPQERRGWGNTGCPALYQVCWPSRYVVFLVSFHFMRVCPILVVIRLRVHGGRPSRGPLGTAENHMKLSLSLHYISTPHSHEMGALGGHAARQRGTGPGNPYAWAGWIRVLGISS